MWLLAGFVACALGAAIACGGSDTTGVSGGGDDGGASSGASGSSSSSGASGSSSSSGDPGADGGHGMLPAGAACTSDAECASGGCDYTKHCALGRSCTQHNGGDTCGPMGSENCCTTLDVPKPGADYKLDKYNITAGRFRTFIEKTKGNVRGYVQANRPSWFETAWDPWLPNVMDDGERTTIAIGVFPTGKGQDGVYQQLGPVHYGAKEMGGNEGCNTSQTGNARTYRLPDDVNTYFGDAQQYTQDILDQKPQQCTTFFMFAAFCIWDGGRLASFDELGYAWNKGQPANYTYPWGNTPVPGGENNVYPYDPMGKFGAVAPPGSDPTVANYKYNFWMPMNMQCIGNDPAKCDYSVFIAPPGRFPKGNGPFGHADLAGNVYDVALPMTGTPGTDPSTRNVTLARTGAFDNHQITAPSATFNTWHAYNKYLAVGARCAR